MNFSDSLKRFRKERNVTQQQVADALKIHKQAYQRYESGKVVPSVEVLSNIAKSFDSDVNYLLGLVDVDSFAIDKIGYKDDNLVICFRNGSLYRYLNVPAEVYQQFLDAPSKGKFFHDNIQYNFSMHKLSQSADFDELTT